MASHNTQQSGSKDDAGASSASSSTGGEWASQQEMRENFSRVFNLLAQISSQQQQQNPSTGASLPSSRGESLAQPSVSTSPATTAPSFLPVASTQTQSGADTVPASSAGLLAGVQGAAGLGVLSSLLTAGGQIPSLLPCSVPSITVSNTLPPVPGYLVAKVRQAKFVDFQLLRPVNLPKLPALEPNLAQLSKICRSDLKPLLNFTYWAEAWAVYAGVVAKVV